MNFKINSGPLFTIIFKLKNDNFKTRDFSPLIERVLAGVWCHQIDQKINEIFARISVLASKKSSNQKSIVREPKSNHPINDIKCPYSTSVLDLLSTSTFSV